MKTDFSELYLFLGVSTVDDSATAKSLTTELINGGISGEDFPTLEIKTTTPQFQRTLMSRIWSGLEYYVTEMLVISIPDATEEIAEAVRSATAYLVLSIFNPYVVIIDQMTFIPFFLGEETSPLFGLHSSGWLGPGIEPIDHETFDPLFTLVEIGKNPASATTLEAKMALKMSAF